MESKSTKKDIAQVILWALNKRYEYQEKVIVFNIDKKHSATENADIVISAL